MHTLNVSSLVMRKCTFSKRKGFCTFPHCLRYTLFLPTRDPTIDPLQWRNCHQNVGHLHSTSWGVRVADFFIVEMCTTQLFSFYTSVGYIVSDICLKYELNWTFNEKITGTANICLFHVSGYSALILLSPWLEREECFVYPYRGFLQYYVNCTICSEMYSKMAAIKTWRQNHTHCNRSIMLHTISYIHSIHVHYLWSLLWAAVVVGRRWLKGFPSAYRHSNWSLSRGQAWTRSVLAALRADPGTPENYSGHNMSLCCFQGQIPTHWQ